MEGDQRRNTISEPNLCQADRSPGRSWQNDGGGSRSALPGAGRNPPPKSFKAEPTSRRRNVAGADLLLTDRDVASAKAIIEAEPERLHPLGGAAVGASLIPSGSLRVADEGGCVLGIEDVRTLDVLPRVGILREGAGETIRLQLVLDRVGATVQLGVMRGEQSEHILDVMAPLMGNDEVPGIGAELVLEPLAEHGGIVDRLVPAAIERPHHQELFFVQHAARRLHRELA